MMNLDPHERPSGDLAVIILEEYMKTNNLTLQDIGINLPNLKLLCDEDHVLTEDLEPMVDSDMEDHNPFWMGNDENPAGEFRSYAEPPNLQIEKSW